MARSFKCVNISAVALAFIMLSSASAFGGFLFSSKGNLLISDGALKLAGMNKTSRDSERVQNENFRIWKEMLMEIRHQVCKGCQIHVSLIENSDHLKLFPTFTDENNSEMKLPELGFSIFKREVTRTIVKTENEFFCQNQGTERNDFEKYIHVTFKVPILSTVIVHGILDETNQFVDLYEISTTQNAIFPGKDSCAQTVVFRLDSDCEDWPRQFYLEKQSEVQQASNWVWFENNNFYLVKHMRGNCTSSSWNRKIGHLDCPIGEIPMESLYRTPDVLPLRVGAMVETGLYQLRSMPGVEVNSEELMLIPYDDQLEVLDSDPVICEFENGQSSLIGELDFDINTPLEKIADTLYYNVFLTSVSFNEYPLGESTFNAFSRETRSRVKKIIFSNQSSLKRFFESGGSLKHWFKNIRIAILKNCSITEDVAFLSDKLKNEEIVLVNDISKNLFICQVFLRINQFEPKDSEIANYEIYWNSVERALNEKTVDLNEINNQSKAAIEGAIKIDKTQSHKAIRGVMWVESKLLEYFDLAEEKRAEKLFYEYRSSISGLDFDRKNLAVFVQNKIELRKEYIDKLAVELGLDVMDPKFVIIRNKLCEGDWKKLAVTRELQKVIIN